METDAAVSQLAQRGFTEYFYSPALAMWRAEEAGLFTSVELKQPVLDLGCGDGSFAGMVFGRRVQIGIDLSFRNMKKADESEAYESLANADARMLPFKSEVFGTVVGNCVLEHIDGIEETLREIARVLRPGGLLIFTVPSRLFSENLYLAAILNRMGMPRMASRYADAKNRRLAHVNVLSPAEWAGMLTGKGLIIVSVKRYMSASSTRTFSVLHDLFDLGVGRYNIANALKQIAMPFRRVRIDKALGMMMARALSSRNGNGHENASGLFIVARKSGAQQ